MNDCLFCKIIAGQIPSSKVYADDQVYAFRDTNPQAPTHTLIVPRQHISTMNAVGTREQLLLGHMLLVAKDLAAEAGLAEPGYRLVFNCNEHGGQTVFHIHLHLLGGQQMALLA